VDRLIALVLLRWRLDIRAMLRVRQRLVGFLIVTPILIGFSLLAAAVAYLAVRGLARNDPALLLALSSAVATAMGIFWVFSPLLAGVTLTETHDVSRLVHFPIPVRTLAASSLIANLVQPLVLAEMPLVLAVALGLASEVSMLPFTLAGVGLTFAVMLALAQVSGLVLLGIARNRRFQDLSLLLGIAFGFLLSMAPMLLVLGGGRYLPGLGHGVLGSDLLAFSPFAWGVRAAVFASRGEGGAFAMHAGGALLAVAVAMAMSAALIGRIHRGELNAGPASAGGARPARMRLPGRLGALVEKDLRVAWRDPALKASLFLSLAGPMFLLFYLYQSGGRDGGGILLLAVFVGASTFGANAFGIERRGLALLFGFPVERWRVLVGKNLGAIVFRLPGLFVLLGASLLLAPLVLVPAALSIAVILLLLGSGVDNFASILVPMPAVEPGRSPHPGASRGLGGALLAMALLLASLVVAAPFVFLCWLPLRLGEPWLWMGTLPIALAGAAAVYAMLVAGAARMLVKREPELLERMLGEP
jgi:ABC-2 type transport system permease protein